MHYLSLLLDKVIVLQIKIKDILIRLSRNNRYICVINRKMKRSNTSVNNLLKEVD